jgi:transcription factor MYB, plant
MNREQSEQIDVHGEQSNGPAETSVELTSNVAPVLKMEDCPVDNCREDDGLCITMLSGCMESCPGNICH